MRDFVYRVIDANFNRVREGLRVCEEFVRFFSRDKALTDDFKKLRNRIAALYLGFPAGKNKLFSAREADADIGRTGFKSESKRTSASEVFWANIQRSKEALRVLEEFAKLRAGATGPSQLSGEFRKLRFMTYELEKKAFKKLKALSGPR